MKIKSFTANNFAGFGEVSVSLDDNLTYLIGKNGSGKSTIGITAIWAIFQGIAEKGKNVLIGERFRFIGNKAATAQMELVLHDEKANADILVKRKITKNSNELSFEAPDGYEVSPAWLENLFNVFLIAPKKFIELSSKQQSEALGIDTSEFDTKIKELKSAYTLINRDITNMGNFAEVEKTEKVDVSELNKEKTEILEFNAQQSKAKDNIQKANDRLEELQNSKKELEEKLKEVEESIKTGKTYLKNLPKAKELKSVEDIDNKINTATETNEKAFQYTQFVEKKNRLEKLRKDLSANKEKQAKQDEERTKYIKSQKLPFDNLEINEDGELLLDGKPIKEPYFSTGELTKLVPILMSSKNPELKYVFIQDFNMLDEDNQQEVIEALTSQGFQLVIELIGTKKVENTNSILLKDCQIVDSYDTVKKKLL